MTLAKLRNSRRVGFQKCPTPWKELNKQQKKGISISPHSVIDLYLFSNLFICALSF